MTVTESTESDPDEPEVVEPEWVESATPPKKSDSGEWNDFRSCLTPKTPNPRAAKSATPAEVIQQGMESFELDGERPSSLEKASRVSLMDRRISRFFFFHMWSCFHRYTMPSSVFLPPAVRQRGRAFEFSKFKIQIKHNPFLNQVLQRNWPLHN